TAQDDGFRPDEIVEPYRSSEGFVAGLVAGCDVGLKPSSFIICRTFSSCCSVLCLMYSRMSGGTCDSRSTTCMPLSSVSSAIVGMQVVLRESQVPPDMREYIKHKT